jgi:acetyl/propionyl-CoA carboxylase alpha subunit
MAQKLALRLEGAGAEAEVVSGPDGVRVRLNDRWYGVDFVPTGRIGLYSLLIDGRSFEVYAEARTGGWDILIGTRVFSVDTGPARPVGRGAAPEPEGVWLLRSPLAGIIVETLVAPGDAVRAGQVVLIVESMKMNNELTAARGGAVSDIYVRPGERVERGVQLLRIE